MAVFTSQFRQLAHGALNWDTQMDADLAALEGMFADLTGLIRYPGSVKDISDVYRSSQQRAGTAGSLSIGAVVPDGLFSGGNLILTTGANAPKYLTPGTVTVQDDGGAVRGWASLELRVNSGLYFVRGFYDGSLRDTIPTNWRLLGNISFVAA